MTIRVQERFQITCDGSDRAGPNPEDVDPCSNTLSPFHHPATRGPTPVWHTATEIREYAEQWGWQHIPALRFEARYWTKPNAARSPSDYEPFPTGEWFCPRHRTDKDKR